MKNKVKLRLLQAGGAVASLVPLAVVVGIDWDTYVTSTASVISLSAGGAIAVVFALLSTLGKIKAPPRIWVFAIIFGLSILLEPIILNIQLLSGMMLAGEGVSLIGFKPFIKRTEKLITHGEQKDVTVAAIKEAAESFSGRA